MTAVAGKYYCRNGKHYLFWKEGGLHSRMVCEKDRLELTRTGDIRSRMCFQKGTRTRTAYQTAQGTLDLEIETRELSVLVTDRKMRIRMAYRLFMKGNRLQDSRMEIDVTG